MNNKTKQNPNRKVATLFEIAEYNAFKKNWTKQMLLTNKDVKAFLDIVEFCIKHNILLES